APTGREPTGARCDRRACAPPLGKQQPAVAPHSPQIRARIPYRSLPWGSLGKDMEHYTVEQAARLLGLHVKTVRGYVRDGRLKAVKIGKQYRIAREDLEAFTGLPLAPAGAARRAEASVIVEVEGVDRALMDRLSTLVLADRKSA